MSIWLQVLQPKLQLHKGPVSSVELRPDTLNLLTVGLDGGINVVNLAALSPSAAVVPFKAGTGTHDCAYVCHQHTYGMFDVSMAVVSMSLTPFVATK